MVQMEMSFSEAIETFMRLTVGDGLVSQIPGLLIATATGIVVTRITTQGNFGTDVTDQLLQYPKLLFIAAGTVFLLGVVTPISFFLTVTIAGILTLGAYFLLQQTPETEETDLVEVEEAEGSAMKSQENVESLLNIDPHVIEIVYAMYPLVVTCQGDDFIYR